MIRLNLFMIWFLYFLSLLSVICRYYRQNSSSRIIIVLVYTVSTFFFVYVYSLNLTIRSGSHAEMKDGSPSIILRYGKEIAYCWRVHYRDCR